MSVTPEDEAAHAPTQESQLLGKGMIIKQHIQKVHEGIKELREQMNEVDKKAGKGEDLRDALCKSVHTLTQTKLLADTLVNGPAFAIN